MVKIAGKVSDILHSEAVGLLASYRLHLLSVTETNTGCQTFWVDVGADKFWRQVHQRNTIFISGEQDFFFNEKEVIERNQKFDVGVIQLCIPTPKGLIIMKVIVYHPKD